MAVEYSFSGGQLLLSPDGVLGTLSSALSPAELAGQAFKLAQSLKEATIAAGVCEAICSDIRHTAMNRLPVVCELLRLGQLFPERDGVRDLNAALLRCISSVCDALHEALTEMYKFMQCGKISQLRQAASVKEFIGEKRTQLKSRFDEVNMYMHLATLLRGMQSAEQAQGTQETLRDLQQQVQKLERVQTADKKVVRARAKATVARQSPTGQQVRLLGPISFKAAHHLFAAAAFQFSDDSVRLATAMQDGTAVVWNADTGRRKHQMHGHTEFLCDVAWSPDGSKLATGSSDSTAAVWDVASETRMHEIKGHESWVAAVAWSPDGSKLATGSHDGSAAVWDVATGACMLHPHGHTGSVKAVAWSPAGSKLATGSFDATAVVWDAAGGKGLQELHGHSNSIVKVSWSPDGSRLATGSIDNTAAVYDAASGKRLHELRGHSDCAVEVAWSPDGSRLATGSHDKTVAVWDVTTGTRMHALKGHSGAVFNVAWSPDGTLLYTAAVDRTVRTYDVARRV